MKKPQLIPNWRQCWRMISWQADALPLAAVGIWQVMPAEWRSTVPDGWLLAGAVCFFVVGVIGRLIQQPKLHRTTGAVEDKP